LNGMWLRLSFSTIQESRRAEAAVASLEERLRQNPHLKFDIRRAIAEGDMVALHVFVRSDSQDRGRAVVDIFG
ncbi:MAG TPA: hypothetical protein VFO40_12365, partial [Chthoniobacterales bacterium]|nr:hypothetical protein [Chthoniobacterales bacterium]